MSASTFEPTNISIEPAPPPAPDYLAGAVLQALARPIGAKLSWGVIKTIVLGVATFGLLPLLAWVRNFHKFAVAEEQQFLHLAQWVRQNSDHPLARQLEADSNELRPRGMFGVLPMLVAVATALGVFLVIDRSGQRPWEQLLGGTFGFHKSHFLDQRVYHFAESRQIFTMWCYGLSAAYLFHWFQIHLHNADVKRFVSRFSQIAQAEAVTTVKASPLGIPVDVLWILAGFLMLKLGAPWGFVAMLAGAAQRRYITTTSRNTRADVAHRLRAILMHKRPSANLPLPVYLRDRCVAPLCRADILRGVNFCPRCGTRQKDQVNRVA